MSFLDRARLAKSKGGSNLGMDAEQQPKMNNNSMVELNSIQRENEEAMNRGVNTKI